MKLISYLKKNVMIIDIKDLSSSQKFHDKLTIDFFIQKDKYFTLYHSISEIITLFDELIKENLFKLFFTKEIILDLGNKENSIFLWHIFIFKYYY